METEDQLQQLSGVSRYKVSYRGVSQGLQKLYTPGSDRESRNILHVLRIREYGHSQYPFTMTLYPDPTQLAHPVRVVTGLNGPNGIAFNSRGEMIVSEEESHQVSIFDIRGQRIRTFGSYGDSPEQMKHPAGIAIDDMDNIYVSSNHKLQKFTSSGQLIKCVGQWGFEEGEFNTPSGITVYDNEVYVCESFHIQVFDLDLNFIRSIIGVYFPNNVKFDRDGNMYVIAQSGVQVLDRSGHFIRMFSGKEMAGPTALHIVDKYVYVCDFRRILVYETSGQFVTSFDESIQDHYIFKDYITSSADGFICVSHGENIKIF